MRGAGLRKERIQKGREKIFQRLVLSKIEKNELDLEKLRKNSLETQLLLMAGSVNEAFNIWALLNG